MTFSDRRAAALLVVVLATSASAQFTITDVTNAGSRIASGRMSLGIAQGALFVATDKGIGPDQFQQATFPLPTTAGLGGVSIQVAAAGATRLWSMSPRMKSRRSFSPQRRWVLQL